MSSLTKAIVVGGSAIVIAACVTGCKKDDGTADANFSTQQQPGAYQQQPGGYQQPGAYEQPGGYQQPGQQPTSQPPPATTPGGYPTGTPATGGGTCTPDPSLAPVAQPALQALGQQSLVPGSKPVGQAMACQMQQGQVMETQIQLQPGKCYSVVAAGLPPVADIEVQIVLKLQGLPIPPGVLAQDQEQGAQAVLGKNPNCYQWALPLPVPATVVVRSVSGSGLVAAQVYEK